MDTVLSESNVVLNSTVKVVLCNFFTRMLKSRWYLMLEKQSCAKDVWYFMVASSMCLQHIEESEIRWLGQMGQWNLDVGSVDVNDLVWDEYLLCSLLPFFLLGHQLFWVVSECWAPEPATERPSSGGVMRTPETERILNPVMLEEHPRKCTK